jgi:hypothetical protein
MRTFAVSALAAWLLFVPESAGVETAVRFERTWQSSRLVGVQPLGRIHEWSDALALGIGLHFAL